MLLLRIIYRYLKLKWKHFIYTYYIYTLMLRIHIIKSKQEAMFIKIFTVSNPNNVHIEPIPSGIAILFIYSTKWQIIVDDLTRKWKKHFYERDMSMIASKGIWRCRNLRICGINQAIPIFNSRLDSWSLLAFIPTRFKTDSSLINYTRCCNLTLVLKCPLLILTDQY